jgi:hypothetical protein
MRAVLRAVSALVVAPCLVATGCTSVLGVTDLPSNACGGATFTSECDVCMVSQCCPEELACAQDPQCTGNGGLYVCALDCNGDSSCLASCGQGYGASVISEANDLLACGAQCTSACASGN